MPIDIHARSRSYAVELMEKLKSGERAAVGIDVVRAHVYQDLQREDDLSVTGYELELLEKETLRHFINGVG